MSKLGALKVKDVWDVDTFVPRDFEEKFRRLRDISPEMTDLARQVIATIQSAEGAVEVMTLDPNNWFWSNGDLTIGTFVLPNKKTYLILLRHPKLGKLQMNIGSKPT